MLSTDAFNALLKTLEEPPAHVLFILATTEAQKVPVTILSRVQRLDFKLASTQDLVTALENIVKSEKIEVEDGVLQVIAKKADGSFRDAVKLLDQVASEGGKITLKKVEDGLKETSFAIKLNILEKIAQKDATAALSLVLEQVNSGTNSKELVFSLMDSLRSALLIKNNLGESVKKELGEDKYNQLVKLSELFTTENIVATFNYLQEALEKMKTAAIPSFPLEVAVIESCAGKMIQSTVTVIETPVIDRPQVESHSLKDDQVIVSNVSELVLEVDESKEVVFSEGMLLLKDKWNYILETVRPTNFSLEALLRQVNITECSDAQVVFEVPYSFHQRIIEAPKSRDLLEAVLSDVLGRQVRVATVLGKRPVTPEDIANVEVAADDEIIRVAAEIFNS